MTEQARERLLVLATPEQAPGYRLAGVAVEAVDDADSALARLEQLLAEGTEGGVIAVPGRYLRAARGALRERIAAAAVPLVIELPDERRGDAGTRQARLRALLARAVGYEMTFEPGEQA
jgi:vacuolar-type H+-ATPase subunit F/Vma7